MTFLLKFDRKMSNFKIHFWL